MDIMTPEHPRWNEFIDRLKGPEGCDIKSDSTINPEIVECKCDSDFDMPFSRKILESIDNIDIEKTLEFFGSYGAECDCQVVFNVFNRFKAEKEKKKAEEAIKNFKAYYSKGLHRSFISRTEAYGYFKAKGDNIWNTAIDFKRSYNMDFQKELFELGGIILKILCEFY